MPCLPFVPVCFLLGVGDRPERFGVSGGVPVLGWIRRRWEEKEPYSTCQLQLWFWDVQYPSFPG